MESAEIANQSFAVDVTKLDLDIPNFNPTKYNKVKWKVFHSMTFFFFAMCYLFASVFNFIIQENEKTKKENFLFDFSKDGFRKMFILVGGFFYFISSIMEWFHFKRGCIGYSNLNSKTKTNRDLTFPARYLRARTGIIYFLCVLASLSIIIVGVIEINSENKKNLKIFFHTFAFFCISLSGIMKLDRITEITKQYNYSRDKSYFTTELLLFIGAMLILFGLIYDIITIDYKDNEDLKGSFYIYRGLYIGGAGCILVSSFFMIYRYFCSGFQDLNLTVHTESEISF